MGANLVAESRTYLLDRVISGWKKCEGRTYSYAGSDTEWDIEITSDSDKAVVDTTYAGSSPSWACQNVAAVASKFVIFPKRA